MHLSFTFEQFYLLYFVFFLIDYTKNILVKDAKYNVYLKYKEDILDRACDLQEEEKIEELIRDEFVFVNVDGELDITEK